MTALAKTLDPDYDRGVMARLFPASDPTILAFDKGDADRSPEHNLAIAVLVDAAWTYLKGRVNTREWKEARDWLTGVLDEAGPLNFSEVCANLSVNESYIRKQILERGKKSIAANPEVLEHFHFCPEKRHVYKCLRQKCVGEREYPCPPCQQRVRDKKCYVHQGRRTNGPRPGRRCAHYGHKKFRAGELGRRCTVGEFTCLCCEQCAC